MKTNEYVKNLWQFVTDMLEDEGMDIVETFAEAVPSFEYSEEKMTNEAIDMLSEDEARSLLFDIGYMAVNTLFGGDFETWICTLEGMGFDEETIDFLNY